MPKIFSLFLFALLLTACAAPVVPATQTVEVSHSATPSPRNPSSTTSPSPSMASSKTPRPTGTITPLPAIPTFTPTFDARTVVTVTLAPKAECPQGDDSLKLNFKMNDSQIDASREILSFLNNGGSMKTVVTAFSKVRGKTGWRFIDLTNDEQPELLFIGFQLMEDTFYIIRCQGGQYVRFAGTSLTNWIHQIVDMNKNGIPEIIMYRRGCSGGGCYRFFIFEWNGETFVDLTTQGSNETLYVDAVQEDEIDIRDLNKDGTLELKLIGASYDYSLSRWRQETHIFIWNGTYFAAQPVQFTSPVYRFQAIQDADSAVRQEQYETAFDLYQNVIFNSSLKYYSRAIEENIYDTWHAQAYQETLPTLPPPDPAEFPSLAGYAYYRMVILHTYLGEIDAAQTKYTTLQEKFPVDGPGHPYAEMATAFLDAYQASGKMYNACAAAIAYADSHPEILTPLGSDYHGWQSHTYIPADVCPFR